MIADSEKWDFERYEGREAPDIKDRAETRVVTAVRVVQQCVLHED